MFVNLGCIHMCDWMTKFMFGLLVKEIKYFTNVFRIYFDMLKYFRVELIQI